MEFNEDEKKLLQRAAMMGLLTALLEDERERTMKEIKLAVLDCLSTMTEFECRVGDFIETLAFEAALQFAQEEKALLDVKEILENRN